MKTNLGTVDLGELSARRVPAYQANIPQILEKRRRGVAFPWYVKKLFASPKTSGDIKKEWLQLEPSTFRELKKRGYISKKISWHDFQTDPKVHDEVAYGYLEHLYKTHGIRNLEDAALWSWKPGWYGKYKHNIENIPDNIYRTFRLPNGRIQKKKAKEVMRQRRAAIYSFLEEFARKTASPSGYIQEEHPTTLQKLRYIGTEAQRMLGIKEYPRISGKTSPITTAIGSAGRAFTGGATPPTAEDILAEKQHPIAAGIGTIAGGMTPYLLTAPLFPANLAGLLGSFATVGTTQGLLRQAGQEKTPLQKTLGAGIEGLQSASFALPFYYANYIRFVQRPILSALARAGVKGAAVSTLSKLYGANLKRALEQGGMITALSLIAETPSLAKTALGRGIIKQANRIAKESGLPEGQYYIDANRLDRLSERAKLSKLLRTFIRLVRTKGRKSQAGGTAGTTPPEALPKPEQPPPEAGKQPKAGGMLHPKAQEYLRKKNLTIVNREPPVRMTKDMTVKDVHGNKVILPAGEEYTPYKLSNNQTLLVDGKELIVDKSQLENVEKQNIKLGQSREILLTGGQPIAGGLTPERREKGQPEIPLSALKMELLDRGFTEKQLERAKLETIWRLVQEQLNPDEVSILPDGGLKIIGKAKKQPKQAPEAPKLEIPTKEAYPAETIAQGEEMTPKTPLPEVDDAMIEEMMKDIDDEVNERKGELKEYLKGKLKPELKKQGEYSNLRHLKWLFAKEGERGYTPDELAGELRDLGFQVEDDKDVLDLIEGYFADEIDQKAAKFAAQYEKKIQNIKKREARKIITPKRSRKLQEELRMKQLRIIASQLTKLAKVAPHLITPKQQAYIHILKEKRLLTDAQYRRLAKIFTSKRTTKYRTPTGRIKKNFMTKEEAQRFIQGEKSVIKRRGRLILPKRGTEIAPEDVATKEKNEQIEDLAKKAKLPIHDPETITGLAGYNFDYLTQQQQDEVIKILQELLKNPRVGDRMRQLMQRDIGEPQNPEIKKEYDKLLEREARIRQSGFDRGNRRIAAGETTSSPLRQQLYLSIKQRLEDVRFPFMDFEIRTGIPFWTKFFRRIISEADKKAQENRKVMNMLLDGITELPNTVQQKKIADYLQSKYEKKEPPKLSDSEKKYAENVRRVLDYFKGLVRKARFYDWLESKLAGENNGLGYTDIPDVDQATLEEGYQIWKTQGDDAVEKWLSTQTFGTIEEGYIPRAVLGGRLNIPQKNIGRFTRRMLRPRSSKMDFSNISLHRRVLSYINSMLNLKYLHKPLSELDKVLTALDKGGHLPTQTAKAFRSWANIVSGYPRDNSALNKLLKAATRQFFRTITVNPKLWFRNVFQRKVTPPLKKPVITSKTARPLSPELEEYFVIHVSQLEPMKYEFLYFTNASDIKIPAIKQYNQLAEKVGTLYTLSDLSNRRSVFSLTYDYINKLVDCYKEGKISLQTLLDNSGYNIMELPEKKEFLRLLDKNPEELAKFVAKWNSDNSQWMYKLAERSFDEISSTNSVLYNLFVWTRGLAQLTGRLVYILASKHSTLRERKTAVITLVGLMLAFEVARRLLNKLLGRAVETGYEGYNFVRSLFWNVGGAMISQANEFVKTFSDLLYAYFYGDQKEKKQALRKALREMDSLGRSFLPFSTIVLGMLEAVTDTEFISPLYNIFYKKPKHVDRSLIQKIQHFFLRSTRLDEHKKAGQINLGNIDLNTLKF